MKLIIFDRDGTINEDREDFVKSPEEWVPLPGALEAIARLNHAGWHAVLATNQSGLGRGLFDMGMLNAMHVRMNQLLAKLGGRIDAVFFCPHTPEDQCDCRKPLPGLMLQIGERYGAHLADVPFVGDSLRDLQAGRAAGCPTHLVRTGKSALLTEPQIGEMLRMVPGTKVHIDLASFAEALILGERERRRLSGASDSGFDHLS